MIRLLPVLLPITLTAGELKVDINRDTKNGDQYTEPAYVKWSQSSKDGATSSGGNTPISRSFTTASGENVNVTFAQTAASQDAGGSGITFLYNNAAASGRAKLIGDGITVAPRTFAGGGQIEMTITGLEAGDHTLLTFHNGADGGWAPGIAAPLDVHVDGSLVLDNLPQTVNATDNIFSASSYVAFSVTGPADTATILFDAEAASGAFTIGNPMINGFEIDTPNIYRAAGNPSPADQDGHVDADSGSVTLSWTAALAGDTVSRDVYFGTDFETVRNANSSSPTFLGNQTGTTRIVSVTDPHATYYWRIDEINNASETTKGTIWSFRPRTLAFPGAEGYGRFARGGRGGQVVRITSLEDYRTGETPIPGTLRHAIEESSGPRTIVFDVAGLITLDRRLTLSDDHITIAGQTAPGKGICLRGYALGLSGSDDTIVRFIRNRPGGISGQTIDGGGLAGCDHSIMDHCSISWSIDEAFSGRSAKHITLQNTLISEALNIAGHQNYPAGTKHGYAATISGDVGSYHHNLLAHCEGRNWSLGGGLDANGEWAGKLDIRNNVVYNWGNRTTDGGAHEVNFVNNYYKSGAATTIFTALNPTYDNFPGTQQYHMAGNVMPGHFDESNQSAGRTVAGSNGGSVPTTYPVWVPSPFFDSHVTTHSAEEAYRRVLSDVGCSQPMLDDHDLRVIGETLSGTHTYTGQGPFGGSPGLPNSQTDVGGWEDYPEESRPIDWDGDGDGMPNWWEALVGTNSDSARGDFSESNEDPEGDGFTRLEDYLNWLASPHGHTPVDTTLTIDLTPLARGFTAPTFSIISTANGSTDNVGGGLIEFTPSSGFSGLAAIELTISGDGHLFTRSINIAVADHPHLSERRWRGGAGDIWDTTSPNWWNGSLLCAWQNGATAVFDSIGAECETLAVNSAIEAGGLFLRGPQYRFQGNGSLTITGDADSSGTVFFTGELDLAVTGTWTNNGVLDLPTADGSIPANLVNNGTVIDSSGLELTGFMIDGNDVILELMTYPDHNYQLYWSPDLNGSWNSVGTPIPGDNTEKPFTHPNGADADARFYRVSVNP